MISTLMMCRYKPSSASSETVGGGSGNAVDGVATIVHEVEPHHHLTKIIQFNLKFIELCCSILSVLNMVSLE